jgi:hypothetical protein
LGVPLIAMGGSPPLLKEGCEINGDDDPDWPSLMGKEPLAMEKGSSSLPGCSKFPRGGDSCAQSSGIMERKDKSVNECDFISPGLFRIGRTRLEETSSRGN